MNHKEIIRLAEEVGLLVKNKAIPYSLPAHAAYLKVGEVRCTCPRD